MKYAISEVLSFKAKSPSVRHGLLGVPVPHEDEHPLLAALRPVAPLTNLKPVVVTVMLQVAERVAPAESRTVSVMLEAFDWGVGHRISPVAASMVIPVGAPLRE